MKSPALDSLLKQDMADVVAFQVKKTPTFYVNGKPLINFSEADLRTLIQKEVDVTYGN